MNASAPVKHCSTCNRGYDARQLICRECDSVLEIRFFNLFVFGTLGVAVVLTIILRLVGVYSGFPLMEVFIWEVVLLVIIYPIVKIAQKRRCQERPVWQEALSVYGDRSGRLLLLVLPVLVVVAVLALLRTRGAPVSVWRVVVIARAVLLVIAAIAFFWMAFADRGWAIFDLRAKQIYPYRLDESP